MRDNNSNLILNKYVVQYTKYHTYRNLNEFAKYFCHFKFRYNCFINICILDISKENYSQKILSSMKGRMKINKKVNKED